jgi:hypothetical protein
MKFTLARPSCPRNPMVAPALFRQAGRHRGKPAQQERQARREFTVELRDAASGPHGARRAPPDPPSP